MKGCLLPAHENNNRKQPDDEGLWDELARKAGLKKKQLFTLTAFAILLYIASDSIAIALALPAVICLAIRDGKMRDDDID